MVSAPTAQLAAEPAGARLPLRLVAAIAEELGELPGAEPWRGEVLRRAEEFQHALERGDDDGVLAAAAKLVGLGEGSTPAGDDYLVGVLHALRSVGASHDVRDGIAGEDHRTWAAAVSKLGPGLTTAASAAWLAAAASGEASPVWRALLEAWAAGDENALRLAARAIRGTGHTSGAFSLRGFLDTLGS